MAFHASQLVGPLKGLRLTTAGAVSDLCTICGPAQDMMRLMTNYMKRKRHLMSCPAQLVHAEHTPNMLLLKSRGAKLQYSPP